jgi:hypothetical protein
MSNAIQESLMSYVSNIEKIYGEKLRAVILYGSYEFKCGESCFRRNMLCSGSRQLYCESCQQ